MFIFGDERRDWALVLREVVDMGRSDLLGERRIVGGRNIHRQGVPM
jgi:hypothetical protein